MAFIDIFGPGSNVENRYVLNHDDLVTKIEGLRKAIPGIKIVLTMGGFDLQHIGHFRYLEKAKQSGDLLIVGLDSDEKLKDKKGEDRPINPFEERMETLAHCRHVDLITKKNLEDPKYNLIRILQPDVLIATQTTYTSEQIEGLQKEFPMVEIRILEPQAKTSTSAKLRRLYMFLVDNILAPLEKLQIDIDSIIQQLKNVGGKKSQ